MALHEARLWATHNMTLHSQCIAIHLRFIKVQCNDINVVSHIEASSVCVCVCVRCESRLDELIFICSAQVDDWKSGTYHRVHTHTHNCEERERERASGWNRKSPVRRSVGRSSVVSTACSLFLLSRRVDEYKIERKTRQSTPSTSSSSSSSSSSSFSSS